MPTRLFTPRSQSAGDAAGPDLDPNQLEDESPRARGLEVLAFLLFTVSLYLGLALSSLRLDPDDPTLAGDNWVGPVGAMIAGVLVKGFGVVAWAAPLELVVVGWPLFKGRKPRLTGLRIAGDLVVAVVLSALAHVLLPQAEVFGHVRSGGNVGLLFGELFEALFSTAGSLLVGTMIVGLILISRASFSFIELCQMVARRARALAQWASHSLRRAAEAWSEAKVLRAQQRAEARQQAAPKIDTKPSDAAIIAQLDDEDQWIPLEKTGAPPLAIADSLRSAWTELSELSPTPDKTQSIPRAESIEESEDEPLASEAEPEGEAPEEPDEAAPMDELPVKDIARPARRAAAGEDADGALKIVDTSHNTAVVRGALPKKQRKRGFALPDTDLLGLPSDEVVKVDKDRVLELADRLVKTLGDYRVTGKVEEVHPGPTVTTYEFSPEAGTKVSKVAGLCDDLALGLSRKVRIIAPIPGKSRIGFELPNDHRVPVNLRELIEDKRFEQLSKKAPLPVVLGRDIVGAPFYADLASMPHVIVAGATGAGKSVGLNVMLSSLLFKRSPEELRMLMIDPKVVELAPFDGIPHMLLPVVTDMKQATKALKWAVDEMERRYQAFAVAGTKNITTYNQWVGKVERGEAQPKPQDVEALTADGSAVTVPAAQDGSDGLQIPGRMPHIVIVVDEFADLMMQQGKEVEAAVARLAQKARAAGMHVVLATQRPSVDVITGMIKANFPTRIAYRVAQKVDSRTILDDMGAELLLGKGDMLVKLNGSTETHRVQCPFVSEEEVNGLCDHLRAQGAPVYHDDILRADDEDEAAADADENLDSRYDEAVRIVAETQRCSTSWLQRKMTIGYNRAAKIVEAMEARGVIGPPNGSKEREIFVHPQ